MVPVTGLLATQCPLSIAFPVAGLGIAVYFFDLCKRVDRLDLLPRLGVSTAIIFLGVFIPGVLGMIVSALGFAMWWATIGNWGYELFRNESA